MIAWLGLWWGCAAEPAAPQPWGQWVWSDADVQVLAESRKTLPDLQAAVWIASVHVGEPVEVDLGYRPTSVPDAALLIRFEDDFSEMWKLSDAQVLAAVDPKLESVLALAATYGVQPEEIQLDYDSPASKLPRWAALLGGLKQGSLKGKRVWITSLVSHLQEPAYGDLFRGTVDGHMIQVFDTGDHVGSAEEIRASLDRANMPFRLGVGAFERESGGKVITEHRRWFSESGPITGSEGYRGTWVFPAGRPWVGELQ